MLVMRAGLRLAQSSLTESLFCRIITKFRGPWQPFDAINRHFPDGLDFSSHAGSGQDHGETNPAQSILVRSSFNTRRLAALQRSSGSYQREPLANGPSG